MAKKCIFETSAVTRCWDKKKARQMVSSGPFVPQNQHNIESTISNTLKSVLLIQRGFRRLLMKRRLKTIAEAKHDEEKLSIKKSTCVDQPKRMFSSKLNTGLDFLGTIGKRQTRHFSSNIVIKPLELSSRQNVNNWINTNTKNEKKQKKCG